MAAMSSGRQAAHALLAALAVGLLAPRPVAGNWLLQCASCVDQSYFGDYSLKDNVKDADLSILFAQLKQVRLREFDHVEDEFYNKFFSKRQLGIVAQELQSIMPSAVAHLPERRWTTMKGMSNVTKNVLLLRDSHLLFSAIASLQVLGRKAEGWDSDIDRMGKTVAEIVEEQNDNRKKREGMLEQIVRILAKVEVLQHTVGKTEEGFVRLDADVVQFKSQQERNHGALVHGLEDVKNRTLAQDAVIANFQEDFRAAVEREARADLVEKRKQAEAEVEVALVKRSIEQLRWEEEQKTIQMRADEQRRSEDHSSKLHQERVAHETAQKKAADLELMQQQEESNIRQEEKKQAGEKELLMIRLKSDERRAEMGVQEAIERAKIEQEAKIREKRDNEDVNLRTMRAEMQEKKQQTLAAIRATADMVHESVSTVYSSPQNLVLAIGSVVACLGGVYLTREMSILLREQLNKRLGRPSLVRKTNRRGRLKQATLGFARLLRLCQPHGSEFNDVVLHPRLHTQVMRLADATRSAKLRRMPLMHVMFYGPPGTGKTMVAERFAEYSGLEYAIMSGGDVAPLQEQAVTELHKLFKWVRNSSRGVLLFIDEADAFLSSRKKGNMSEPLRNALTTMLYHTGTPTSQFMMVLATNRPGDLDSAALDRIDECVEFGLPELRARESMVKQYFSMYVGKPLSIDVVRPDSADRKVPDAKTPPRRRFCRKRIEASTATPASPQMRVEDLVDDVSLAEVARRIDGFSGREIAKLFNSLQTHILFSARRGQRTYHLLRTMLFDVVDAKVLEHSRTMEFQVSGYNYTGAQLSPTAPVGATGMLPSPMRSPAQQVNGNTEKLLNETGPS